jgi:pimeloyl-ACP methyl ester carboxylesterase
MIARTRRGKDGEREITLRAKPVEFAAADGIVLRGNRYGVGDRWAVLVHDEGRDSDVWRRFVVPLSELGLCVLAFDLRGHGASDDPWEPMQAPRDVLGALRFAQTEGARKLVGLGEGAGATAALAAGGDHELQALVLYSPRAAPPGLDADVLRESNAPKLIVVGGHDPDAAAAAAEIHRRSIGWGVLESPPVEEQGADLLDSEWGWHVAEHTLGFLRDYV